MAQLTLHRRRRRRLWAFAVGGNVFFFPFSVTSMKLINFGDYGSVICCRLRRQHDDGVGCVEGVALVETEAEAKAMCLCLLRQ